MSPRRSAVVGLLGSLVFLLGAGLGGEFRAPGETPIEDVIQVLVLDREVVAIDGLAGTDLRIDLELGETVLATEARGRVAIALTDRRILACAVRSAAWQQERYRRGETPGVALVGEQVAIIVTPKRALGFDSRGRNLFDVSIGPNERVLAVDASGAVGVVITDRRALGISPFAGGFFTAGLGPGESIEAVAATGNVATVRTSRRILTFQAVSGAWIEVSLD